MFKQQNPCSNYENQVPFEHGFWRHVVRKNKMADVEEDPQFSVSVYVVNDIFMRF